MHVARLCGRLEMPLCHIVSTLKAVFDILIFGKYFGLDFLNRDFYTLSS
jgi:hypothetical protein